MAEYLVKTLWVYLKSCLGVLLRPLLENCAEVRADLLALHCEHLRLLIEIVLDSISAQQEIEDDTFVVLVLCGVADDVSDILGLTSDDFIMNIPSVSLHDVRKEYAFEFVDEKPATHSLQ